MAINVDRAQELSEEGLALSDDQGNVNFYLTSGTGDPSGSSAPINTWFFRQDTRTLYYKFGAGNNDWRQVRAQDITFDPSGLPAFSGTENTIFKALSTLGAQTIEDLAEIQGFDSPARETTTSNGWVSKSGFPWTSDPKSAGVYSVRWFYEVGQTKATRNFGYRTLVTAPTAQTLTEIPISGVANDNQLVQQGGFQEYALMADGPITVDIQFGQTTSGFSAIMNNAVVEVRRTGDLP